jgi:hypothetical protein
VQKKPYFISEDSFRVWLPDVVFKSEADNEKFDSRKLSGIMSTDRRDRQGEVVTAKGLDFSEFLHAGHFNDNHSQETSAIVGYPQSTQYHADLGKVDPKYKGVAGWTCTGYVLKGTKRSDGIWELAEALQAVPNKKLGFSIEGKVTRRANKTIESAKIRNVAITNCPVNTDCTWNLLEKSFADEEYAMKSLNADHETEKALMAGSGVGTDVSGGSALRVESLDSDPKEISDKKLKRKSALKSVLHFDDMLKAMDFVLERRPDFDEEAAAVFVNHLYKKGKP